MNELKHQLKTHLVCQWRFCNFLKNSKNLPLKEMTSPPTFCYVKKSFYINLDLRKPRVSPCSSLKGSPTSPANLIEKNLRLRKCSVLRNRNLLSCIHWFTAPSGNRFPIYTACYGPSDPCLLQLNPSFSISFSCGVLFYLLTILVALLRTPGPTYMKFPQTGYMTPGLTAREYNGLSLCSEVCHKASIWCVVMASLPCDTLCLDWCGVEGGGTMGSAGTGCICSRGPSS